MSSETIRLWQSTNELPLGPEPLAELRDGAIVHLVINRPAKRNALTAEVWEGLGGALERIAKNDEVRLVVLRGAGTRAFSAGADIEEFPRVYGDAASTRRYNDVVRATQLALERLPQPTLAVIHGSCVGGGCGLALACDLRFAAEDSRFGITPSRLGASYSPPDTRRLVALVGPSHAKDILFSGRLLSAAEALTIGLVDRVLPSSELDSGAADYAAMLLGNSQQSIRTAKLTINAISGVAPRAEDELERRFAESFASPDFREGFEAFREKRRPRFS